MAWDFSTDPEFEEFWRLHDDAKYATRLPARTATAHSGGSEADASILPPASAPLVPRTRVRRCERCAGCTRSDCGACNNCKDKPKFNARPISVRVVGDDVQVEA